MFRPARVSGKQGMDTFDTFLSVTEIVEKVALFFDQLLVVEKLR